MNRPPMHLHPTLRVLNSIWLRASFIFLLFMAGAICHAQTTPGTSAPATGTPPATTPPTTPPATPPGTSPAANPGTPASPAQSGSEPPGPGYQEGTSWELDLATGEIVPGYVAYKGGNMRNLPFDVAFTLKFKNLDPTVKNVEVCVVELTRDNVQALYDKKVPFGGCDLTGDCYCSARWERNDGIVGQVPQVVIPPLEPNRQYRFVLHATTGLPAPFRQTMIEQTARAAATFYYENLASILNPLIAQTRQQELDKKTSELLTLLNAQIQELAKKRGYSNVQPDLGSIEKRMKNDVNSGLTDISKAILALWQPENFPSSLESDLSGNQRVEAERIALNNLLNKIFKDRWSTDYLQGAYVYGSTTQALDPWTVTEGQVKNIPLRVENIKKNRKRLEDYHKEATEKVKALEAKIKAGLTGADLIAAQGELTQLGSEVKRIEEVFIPKIERNISLFEALYKVVPQLEERIAKAIDDMRLILSFEVPFSVNTSRDFKTRATWYFAPDFGAAYVFGERTPADLVTFYGVQFHLFPINREVSYSLFRKEDWRYETRSRWVTALSINFGLTANNFTASSPEYKGVIGDKIGVLAGLGLRLTEMLRINGGFLFTRREDPHPLRTDLVLHANPFVGVTLDVDLVKYVQDLGTRRATRLITEQ